VVETEEGISGLLMKQPRKRSGNASRKEEGQMVSPGKRMISVGCVATLLSVASAALVAPAFGEDLAKGKKVYVDRCLKCHGEKGKGDGPKAEDLKKKPADYTDKAKMAKVTDADLKKVLKEGKSPMPAFGKKLTDEQVDDVIGYVRSFAETPAQK
jgi:mono/diheme cytochrome c family protein